MLDRVEPKPVLLSVVQFGDLIMRHFRQFQGQQDCIILDDLRLEAFQQMSILLQFLEFQEIEILQKLVDEWKVLSERRRKFLNRELLFLNLHELQHLPDGPFFRIFKEQTEVVHQQSIKFLCIHYLQLVLLMIDLHDDHKEPIEQTSVRPILFGVAIDMEMGVLSAQVKDHLEKCLKVMSRFREELEKVF